MESTHGPMELLYKMKLERIKELRLKSVQLEKVKTRLLQEVEETENEEERMKEYHNEMELLNQEKMAHVEELRQIHADINAIENVVKHAEQDRNRAFESACQAYQDYMALKGEIDSMRNVIGLDMLPNLSEDDGRLTPNYFRKRKSEWQKDDQTDTTLPAPLTIPTTTSPSFQLPSTSHSEERPPFRQQPPPMKNCLSCHQQIHRNAPICPLCKAKSRSRNPKKPKRKQDTN